MFSVFLETSEMRIKKWDTALFMLRKVEGKKR